jgi:putative ABC transport system ATP-binding protein
MTIQNSEEQVMTNTKPIVKLSGVYKIFKQGHLEVIALKNIELTVSPGELIVIMGPSGSGKTTLLNVISGMEKPSAGSIQVKGLEVSRLKDEGIQKLLQYEIGIIFQFFNLIPSLTAAGNIELPMNIIKIPKEERRKRVARLLDQVGLKERAKHRPFTLSGGEKQRVAIAQAFANNPSLILADEPTGNIDSISAEKIMEIFHNTILKNPDKAIIIVTHDPAFRKIADRTLVLRDGEIIRQFGKLDMEKIQTQSLSIDDEIDKIVSIEDKHSKAKDILANSSEYPNIEDISNCPNCKSDNILKNYDKQNLTYSATNQHIITNIAIACYKCQKIHFQTGVVFDIKQIVRKNQK